MKILCVCVSVCLCVCFYLRFVHTYDLLHRVVVSVVHHKVVQEMLALSRKNKELLLVRMVQHRVSEP